MSENATFDAIFAELCHQHAVSGVTDLAIARLLALLLTEDQPDVGKITQLRAALPPKVSGAGAAAVPAWAQRLRDCDVVLLDALVACGEALEDPEKSWSETRGLVHEAVLAHPAAEGLRSRLQLNEELIALSPTEMLFVPLVEDLPRKEGGGWSPEVHAVLAAEAKRLVGMARHAPDEAAGAVLLEPEIPGERPSSASDVSTKVVRLVPPSGGIPGGCAK